MARFGRRTAGLLVAAALVLSGAAGAEETEDSAEGGDDEDPTKTVVLNLRYEHRELLEGGSRDLVLLRRDAAIRGGAHRPLGHRFALLRFDLPVGWVEARGQSASGLGDLYAQALHVHPFSRKFALASGSGVLLPTAGDDLLGAGKWQVAPLVVPIWNLTRPRGMFFCKVQDYFSVAGKDHRPDIHALAVTPTMLWRFHPSKWLLADSEAVVDWRGDRTAYRSGLLFGTALGPRRGAWIKLEVPWGEHRIGDWTAKTSFTWRGRH